MKHMYDCLSSVTMACIPQSLAYSNGKLVAGEPSGCVKVIDFSNGQCLQTFNDHKAAVTDIYAVSNYNNIEISIIDCDVLTHVGFLSVINMFERFFYSCVQMDQRQWSS